MAKQTVINKISRQINIYDQLTTELRPFIKDGKEK